MAPESTIAFPTDVWAEISSPLASDVETAGVLLAGVAETDQGLTFTVNRVEWVEDGSYLTREALRLEIASSGWMPALKAAAHEGLHAIFFHTHPGGAPTPSIHDSRVDAALAASFLARTGSSKYASFILGGTPERPTFTGRVVTAGDEPVALSLARVVGNRLSIVPAFDSPEGAAESPVHERQVRAFGADGQRVLSQLRVGIVGAGGTGSAVIEQLVRLGVKDLVVIDDDTISSTNVSRVYGSSVKDEGMAKVDVAAASADRIGLGARVRGHRGRIDSRAALELLCDRDVIFGCTDDHTGRLNLCRLSSYYLIPVIDVGVAIDAPGTEIRSITGRVSWVSPGGPCLVCTKDITIDQIREEAYPPAERERLAGEGYATGLGEPDPSVVAYTTLVAAWGIANLVERLFGFGEDNPANRLIIRIADHKMRSDTGHSDPGHFCADRSVRGQGDAVDFLGQRVWLT